MIEPKAVELQPHDPEWAGIAEAEAKRIGSVADLEIHHIGSTAIAGLAAKPVIDLLGVASKLEEADWARAALEALGYDWRGEYGLEGRRYCTADAEMRIHLHIYAAGDPAIRRHLAFRDYLRTNPHLAREYEKVKRRCLGDSRGYQRCKADWIARIEAQAVGKMP